MKAFLATWRNVQDTIVRHPFCRYTILPAGIILAIWLVALPTMAWNWWQEGHFLTLIDLTEEYVVRLRGKYFYFQLIGSIALAGLILTGRWVSTLAGLIYMLFPLGIYGQSEALGYGGLAIFIFWLMALAPIVVWMRGMDRRLEPISTDSPPVFWFWAQPLNPRMRKLAWGAAVFCLLQIPVSLCVGNCWILNGMLLALLAGVLFAVVVDIVWRISPGSPGRGLVGGVTAGLSAFSLSLMCIDSLFYMNLDGKGILKITMVSLLAGIVGYFFALLPGRDDALNQTKP